MKRRLAASIGVPATAMLARAFFVDTLALLAASEADRRVVVVAPPSARRRIARSADGALVVPQRRGGFGARLDHALATGLAHARRAVVIGADSPTLSPRTLRSAFAALVTADCVIGPADDGGYYLIGARRRLPDALFRRMPWSTGRVFDETLRRAHAAGLRVAVLPRWYDVDDAAGLRRLGRDRAGLGRAPATRAALATIEGARIPAST